MDQHDAHVRLARQGRTVFMAEISPGKNVSMQASWLINEEKMLWMMMRMIEGKRMEIDGAWRQDMVRLEAAIDARKSKR